MTTDDLTPLASIAALGEPESATQDAWRNLMRVHGVDTVVWACARCLALRRPGERPTPDEAQAVLDGRRPGMHFLRRPHERRGARQRDADEA